MSSKVKSKDKSPLFKVPVIPSLVLGVLLLVVLVWFISPNDGVNNFSGAQKIVATSAVNFEHKNSSISPLPEFLQHIHVDEVRPITQTEKNQYCTNPAYTSDSTSDPHHYAVVMSLHRLFDPNVKTVVEYGCSFLQFDPNYLK